MKRAIIYGKPGCGYCRKAKKLLEEHNIPYEDIVIGLRISPQQVKEHCQKLQPSANVRTVPQIIIIENGQEKYIGGFAQLDAIKHTL